MIALKDNYEFLKLEVQALDAFDFGRIAEINSRVKGWSKGRQYLFFKRILDCTDVRDILMLGVYHGRDICFLLDVVRRFHPNRYLNICGVDRFTDESCDDWPDDKSELTWGEAGFGLPPNEKSAMANISEFTKGTECDVFLIPMDDSQYLRSTRAKYDLVYLDTSHDEETVLRQIRESKRVLKEDGLICGDDFSNRTNWGVKNAVEKSVSSYFVIADWIWVSSKSRIEA